MQWYMVLDESDLGTHFYERRWEASCFDLKSVSDLHVSKSWERGPTGFLHLVSLHRYI